MQHDQNVSVTFPLGPFVPASCNPVMSPGTAAHENGNVYNPAAVVRDGQVCLLYRAHGPDLVSRVCLATSEDGLNFTRRPAPVLEPTEPYETKGCEDPRVTEVNGTYYLTYTGWDGTTALLCLATSDDLVHWHKHGPLFPGFNSFALDQDRQHPSWTKAGAILPTPIGGRYLMYFGEGSIYYAWSDDLIHWTPCPQDSPVLAPEPGTFMANLVEVGPQPVLMDNGLILLLHNAAVFNEDGSVSYSCGQALISPDDPGTVIAKMTRPWLSPHTHEEHNGLVAHVTFVEGLVPFEGKWFAYYGQSDTTIGVAISEPSGRYGNGSGS